jgi:hypothetical protein
MGLDFNYGNAHFSYSGFHEFRVKLASLANFPYLDNMEGFSGSIKWDLYNDDIIPLLRHSDCDGELTVKECLQIIPRLKELIEFLPEEYPNELSYDNIVKIQGQKLCQSMEEAAKDNQPLRFQ